MTSFQEAILQGIPTNLPLNINTIQLSVMHLKERKF